MSLSFSGRKKGTKESPRILKDEYIFGIRVYIHSQANGKRKAEWRSTSILGSAGLDPLKKGP